jgi:hypothetical protein
MHRAVKNSGFAAKADCETVHNGMVLHVVLPMSGTDRDDSTDKVHARVQRHRIFIGRKI